MIVTAARLVVVAVVAAVLFGGCGFLGVGSSSSVDGSGEVSVFHLHPGQCVKPPTSIKAQVATLDVVSCKKPHTEQVYALVRDHGGANYPGSSVLEKFANAQCLQRFAAYVGVDYQYSQLYYTYLLPSVLSWASEDRTVVCVITTTGQQLTGSVKGSKL